MTIPFVKLDPSGFTSLNHCDFDRMKPFPLLSHPPPPQRFYLILLTLLTRYWTYYEIVLVYKGGQWQISEIMVLPPPSVNCPPFWKQISWLVWHSNLDIILWKILQRSLDYSNISQRSKDESRMRVPYWSEELQD